MEKKSSKKLKKQTSFYGSEVRYEMLVYLDGFEYSSPYMLTLTTNSLDFSQADISPPQMQPSRGTHQSPDKAISTPNWFKGKPTTKEASLGVKSLSTSHILGITYSASTDNSVVPYQMVIYHLPGSDTPSFNSRISIVESYFYFNSPTDCIKLKQELGIASCKARWLIFVNPAGGKGQAKVNFERAKPILESAGIEVVLHETRFKDDAYTYIQEISKDDFKKFDVFVCCSGDGIIHELINGFYQRKDYSELVLRIGALPGGSGCALLFNSLRDRGLDFTLDNAIYLLLRGELQSMPLFKYTLQPYNRPGYLADVDLGSETLRFLGSTRFEVYGAFKLLWPSTLACDVVTRPPVAQTELSNFYPYLSLALVNFPYIAQTFGFEGSGFHCLTRRDNLIPFVLKQVNRQCQKVNYLEIKGMKDQLVSIDGEIYKADSIVGELVQETEIKEETVEEVIEEKPSPDTIETIAKRMFLGKVLRIA